MSLDLQTVLDELQEHRLNRRSTSAATMTLISFIEDPRLGEVVRDRTRALADKHPSRAIILDASQPLGAHRTDGSVERGEWIEIGVGGASAEQIGSIADALSLGEAPLIVHWAAGGIGSDDRFAALARRARVVVCNSSLVEPGTGTLRELGSYAKANPDAHLHDLAFLRLAPWQECIASFFDDTAAAEDLLRLETVAVACGTDAESYYLLGWLGSRLGWEPRERGRFDNRFGDPIAYRIERSGEARRPGRVSLASRASCFTVELVTSEGVQTLEARVTGERARPARRTPINGIDVPTMIERAILLLGQRNDVFHDSLASVAAIFETER
ncbi:MAG: glucose-6-phosphate dehydrogenase assembly protein OpcA [Vulcanimicrobiaceae bacterium]